MNLEGKVAVVTGGTGGLGWRICKNLADAKMKVVLVYLSSEDKALQYVDEIKSSGTDAIAVQADITTSDGIHKMKDEALARFGALDALVLDAAINQWVAYQDIEGLTPELWGKIINFNLTAPYLAMRIIGPYMKNHGGGRIVTVSSTAGFGPTGSSIAYAVSKSGLIHLTRCMAVALAPSVLVNGVVPGLLEGTKMTANLSPAHIEKSRRTALIKRAVECDEVAGSVRHLIEADSITGQNLVIDGGKVFR